MIEHRLRQGGSVSAVAVVVAALLLAFLAYGAMKFLTRSPAIADSNQKGEKPAVVTVSTAAAEQQSIGEVLRFTGDVAARDRLEVGAEIGGLKIDSVLVEEGDHVYAGQTLATLNSEVMQARLRQLQARYRQASANLSKARQPNRELEISGQKAALYQARASVEAEEANLALAKANLENARRNTYRYRELFESGAIPEQELENRETEYRRQQAQVKAAADRVEAARFAARQAEDRLGLLRQGGSADDVQIASASRDEIAAQIEELQAQLRQTHVTAPTDGWVLERAAHLGDIATVGQPLFTLARDSELELRGKIPETEVSRLEVGQTADVLHGDNKVEATIWKISPQVDPQTREATVRLALPSGKGLRPGMFAEAELKLKERRLVTVPAKAIQGESPDYFVFLLDQQSARKQPVTVALRRDDKAAISEGLQAGQEVIVEGAGFLADGDRVSL